MIFKFWEEPDDQILILGKKYQLNLTFGNVMSVFELKQITEEERVKSALFLLLGEELDLPFESQKGIFKYIQDEYLSLREAPRYQVDAWGNVINLDDEEEERCYDLLFDAKEIYASFMQAYQIDLLAVKDSLHWYKFNALLAGLPATTPFKQIVEIRTWKPHKTDSKEYQSQMRKLQKEVALPILNEGGENNGQSY
jgi:hypothetical protein